jgi:hypothetical protein
VRPLVIELVGPAGAGKSTLAHQLGDRLGASSAPLALWGLPRFRLAAHAARLLPTFWGFVRDGQQPLWAEQTQLVRLEALSELVERRRGAGQPVVLDEGPVFALSWMEVFYPRREGPRRAAWRRRVLGRWARLLDLIVLVDAPDPVLTYRVRTRSKAHPLKHSPDAVIHAFAARFRSAFNHVAAELRAASGPRLVTLYTGDEPSGRTAERLMATVERSIDVD